MKIFKDEVEISKKIKGNTSISCLMAVEPADKEDIKQFKLSNIGTANIKDEDLFYHKSLLVTTNWNGNDDVFLPDAVWAARHTPVHKPTNINHQSSRIVGHMTGNWAVSADGNLIDDDTPVENLPSKFHILTGAVIYRNFHNDPEYQAEVATLISEIESGEQFVSMECSFDNFGYAISSINPDGSLASDGPLKIIERNENTAFLSKHLRAYGGTGIYEGHKVGRVLKNISFIGKAYTKQPANKESIIFCQDDIFDFANASIEQKNLDLSKNSVSTSNQTILNGDDSMSDSYQDQIKELKELNASLSSEVKSLKETLSKADVEKYKSEIELLKADLTQAKSDAEVYAETLKAKDEAVLEANAKSESLSTELATVKAELDQLNAEKVFAGRVSMLVEGNVDKAKAETKVKLFEKLNDEQFAAVAEELIAAATVSAPAETTETENAEAADLENSSVEEEVTVASETQEENTEVKDLITALAQKIKVELEKNGDK